MIRHNMLAVVSILLLGQQSDAWAGMTEQTDPVMTELQKIKNRAIRGESENIPGNLMMDAAHLVASKNKMSGDISANVVMESNNGVLFLVGEKKNVATLKAGTDADGVSGILLSRTTDQPTCLGIVENITAADINNGIDSSTLSLCGISLTWEEMLDQQISKIEEENAYDSSKSLFHDKSKASSSCSSTCGSNDGNTFVDVSGTSQIAKSNGSYTATGSSCNGSSTYGYQYQCVEYVERVHNRSAWSGNAYTGYWSSTSSGPYQKGLLPLKVGNTISPPKKGDIVVWSGGTYGHVGLVASTSSSSVKIYDQNRSCGSQQCELTYSSSSGYSLSNKSCISSYSIAGYLRRGWDFSGYWGLSSSANSSTNWWTYDMSYTSGTSSSSNGDPTDYIKLNPGATDPYMTSPSGQKIPAYSSTVSWGFKKFVVRIKSSCSNKTAQLFWKSSSDTGFSSSKSASATISGSDWNTITFDMSNKSTWTGMIDQIRLDPATSCSSSSSTDDSIYIQYAYFTN